MPDAPLADGYHTYFVSSWLAALTDQNPFPSQVPDGRISLPHPPMQNSALRAMSECMYALGDSRSGDWEVMRSDVANVLQPEGYDILTEAEQSSDKFAAFFATFARARTG